MILQKSWMANLLSDMISFSSSTKLIASDFFVILDSDFGIDLEYISVNIKASPLAEIPAKAYLVSIFLTIC